MGTAGLGNLILKFASSGILGVVFVIVILVMALIFSLIRKTFMQIWQTIIFIVLFALSYFIFKNNFGTWICDKFILQFGLNTSVVVNNIEVYEINNFTDLIELLGILANDTKYTAEYAYTMSHSMCHAMALGLLTIANIFVSPIIALLTWPIIKLFFPKKLNAINLRFPAPIIGLLEVSFALIVVINCYSSYSEGLNVLIKNFNYLEQLNMSSKLFNVMKLFSVDFFGFFKALNFKLFNFQFAAGGEIYNLSSEFAQLASKVFPESIDDSLINSYKETLLNLWMNNNGVAITPSSRII